MKYEICIVTANRAEYGLLKPLILKMQSSNNFILKLVITGSHLVPYFGETKNEILIDGLCSIEEINILLATDSPDAVSKSIGIGIINFADYLKRNKPDGVLLIGDRSEMLAFAIPALIDNIPIIHIHGGEVTNGAIDDSIRHALTKLSRLHFASNEVHKRRIIQLGEQPSSVFNVGALGVENIKNLELLNKSEVLKSLEVNNAYAMVTYHPVTNEPEKTLEQLENLLSVLKEFKDIVFIFTKSNSDVLGMTFNKIITDYSIHNENIKIFDSLGARLYLSCLKFAVMVIGNSSSGIIEAPSFKLPTINIGNRQNGRVMATSILNCGTSKTEIRNAIKIALSSEFKEILKNVINPYEGKDTSIVMTNQIFEFLSNKSNKTSKKFYDIEVTE